METSRDSRVGHPVDTAELRGRHFGRGLALSYREPLAILRGRAQYLYDSEGTEYLDCVNSVFPVGHCHPKVLAATAEQTALLGTGTHYLHPKLAQYVKAITDTFPETLSVCYLTCSGSEAVELALRLARTFTKAQDMIALASACHGSTEAAIGVSHYRFAGPGGTGCPPSTHVVPVPCVYRGRYRGSAEDPGKCYAQLVSRAVDEVRTQRRRLAGFIC